MIFSDRLPLYLITLDIFMERMNLLSDRIKWLYTNMGLTQADVARAAGVRPPSVNDWETGKTKGLRASVALTLARNLGISHEWLVTGQGLPEQRDIAVLEDGAAPDPDLYVQIPESRVRFACGDGNEGYEPSYEDIQDSDLATYKRSWFQQKGVNPAHCKRFRIVGSSMEPTLYDGEWVLVDLGDTHPIKSGRVYAVIIGQELKVKRLVPLTLGGLVVKSDNTDVPPITIGENRDADAPYFRIIGRVIERSGDGGL